MREIVAADLFCGAGGTSTGLYRAAERLGLQVRLLAVNHWQVAIATHQANHPEAEHRCENLDNVDPRHAVPGGYLDLLVASPECTHHSRARGGRPRSDQSRASAWHVLRWAEALYVESILIENVREFMEWGPLDREGNPVRPLKGKTYLAFLEALRSLGYYVDARLVNCADYGDPTTRQRLFVMARRSGPVCWPEPTHRRSVVEDLTRDRRPGWRPAREIIDWSLPGESIFGRKRPLSENTLKRIAAGLRKYSGLPFVIGQQSCAAPRSVAEPLPTLVGTPHVYLAQPFIVPTNHGKDTRAHSVDEPMRTVTSVDAWGLIEPFIVKMDQGGSLHGLGAPMPTITSADAMALVEPFVVNYNGTGHAHSVDDPLDTVTGKDRFGLVLPLTDGRQALLDIRFRMLQPHELAAAMSFPKEYQFSGNREERVKQIGNAVPVRTAAALCEALLG